MVSFEIESGDVGMTHLVEAYGHQWPIGLYKEGTYYTLKIGLKFKI